MLVKNILLGRHGCCYLHLFRPMATAVGHPKVPRPKSTQGDTKKRRKMKTAKQEEFLMKLKLLKVNCDTSMVIHAMPIS